MKKDLRAEQKHSFWIINVSKLNVSLTDLGLTIHVGQSFNLLDPKRFSYTLEQLEASLASGSLFLKRDRVKVRNNPPKNIIRPGLYITKEARYAPFRSAVKIKEEIYEELIVEGDQFSSEERFADEFSGEEEVKTQLSSKK